MSKRAGKSPVTVYASGRVFDDVREQVQWLIREQAEAVICPCCDQHAMVCKRKITPHMMTQLMMLYKSPVPLSSVELQQGPAGCWRLYSLLRFWNLVENPETDLWQISPTGNLFVLGLCKVRKYAFVYNNTCVGFGGVEVSAADCAREKFSLPEVFSAQPAELAHG